MIEQSKEYIKLECDVNMTIILSSGEDILIIDYPFCSWQVEAESSEMIMKYAYYSTSESKSPLKILTSSEGRMATSSC